VKEIVDGLKDRNMNTTRISDEPDWRSYPAAGEALRRRRVGPLAGLLRELGAVVTGLDDGQYVRNPVGVIQSSVGGHVRHALDHVRSLLAAVASGHLDYDRRERGTAVESSRACALEQIETLAARLEGVEARVLTWPLSVSVTMSSGDVPVVVTSSVSREMAYVLSHTIHHNAIVNAMVRTLGGRVPERFGYAPSTITHLEKAAMSCAR
jgi:uncharacterized damage-inducible protein DinB